MSTVLSSKIHKNNDEKGEEKLALPPDSYIKFNSEVKVLEKGEMKIYIHPSTGKWGVVKIKNDKMREILALIEKGIRYKEIIKVSSKLAIENIIKKFYRIGLLEINNKSNLPLVSKKEVNFAPHLFILILGERCNLQCTYCFLNSPYYSRKVMEMRTAIKALDLIVKLGIDPICIEFAGGEPFLRWKVMKNIVEYVHTKYPDKDIKFRVQTNGTIFSREIIQFIKKFKIGVSISLDGPSYIHDRHRIYKTGKGSFEIIMKNLDLLKKENVKFGILTVISSYHDYEKVVDFFLSQKILCFRLNPVFVYQGRASVHFAGSIWNYKDFAKEYYKIFKKIFNINCKRREKIRLDGIQYFLYNLILEKRIYMCKRIPCGAGLSQLAINWDGRLYPCQEMVGLKDFMVGTVDSSPEEIKNNIIIRKLKDRNIDNIEECKKCIWRAVCCSPCVNKAYRVYKKINAKDPLCEYYKCIYSLLIWDIAQNPQRMLEFLKNY